MGDLEARRYEALCSYDILDTPPEPAFDEIAALAAHVCDTPIAFVGLMDGARQWFKAKVGLLVHSVPRESSICRYALDQPDVLVIPDTLEDSRVSGNPHVTGEPHVRFYAGAPLTNASGVCLGTLCVLDGVPRSLEYRQKDALAKLANQVVAQLELRRAMLELQRNREQLLELQWHKEELTELIVHDLKTPLAAIIGWTELMLTSKKVLPEVNEFGTKVVRIAHRMNRMVLDLLDIARSENGELHIDREPVPLLPLAHEAGDAMRPRLSERRISLTIADTVAGCTVFTDREMMRRVLENLLDNCVKYAPAGSRVQVEVARALDGMVEFTVSDEGPGIPVEARDKIFQKFVRLDRDAGVASARSHGLGLVYCKLAVEASGGTIKVDNREPTGAVFRVRLPTPPESEGSIRGSQPPPFGR